jgi:hypothetical protein
MLLLSGQVQRLHSIHPIRRSPKRSISISGPLQRGQRLSTKGFTLHLSVNVPAILPQRRELRSVGPTRFTTFMSVVDERLSQEFAP